MIDKEVGRRSSVRNDILAKMSNKKEKAFIQAREKLDQIVNESFIFDKDDLDNVKLEASNMKKETKIELQAHLSDSSTQANVT